MRALMVILLSSSVRAREVEIFALHKPCLPPVAVHVDRRACLKTFVVYGKKKKKNPGGGTLLGQDGVDGYDEL